MSYFFNKHKNNNLFYVNLTNVWKLVLYKCDILLNEKKGFQNVDIGYHVS